jgi:hypothetical protein
MSEQHVDQEPLDVENLSRKPPPQDLVELPVEPDRDKVPEIYRWHDCM